MFVEKHELPGGFFYHEYIFVNGQGDPRFELYTQLQLRDVPGIKFGDPPEDYHFRRMNGAVTVYLTPEAQKIVDSIESHELMRSMLLASQVVEEVIGVKYTPDQIRENVKGLIEAVIPTP